MGDSMYYTIEPTTLVDEVSSTEIYVGVSNNGKNVNSPVWKIKKIMKTDNVWDTGMFPSGSQDYTFVWEDRASYNFI